MKCFLRTKPDIAHVKNNGGQTALDIALENDFQLCAELVGGEALSWCLTYRHNACKMTEALTNVGKYITTNMDLSATVNHEHL